ncbi:uncharacterized protein B0H18DRAFT_633071 [Fomitopsis serialis]|uniref:uncharacterized protein n=1 Tax=Fomitopsis serialis TaxID=139415 RepID=UPI002008D623|nr:uncharacterized protein B0H18DRAFT_633071 [Neoantrodia serialis]KAH9919541.1 hypothetical protein B0H18DRAFT_633071 [Neoantrodia serialis]
MVCGSFCNFMSRPELMDALRRPSLYEHFSDLYYRFPISLSQTATTPSNPNTTSSISTESLATSPPTVTSSAPLAVRHLCRIHPHCSLCLIRFCFRRSRCYNDIERQHAKVELVDCTQINSQRQQLYIGSHAHVFTPAPAENISDSFQTSSSTFMHPTITLSKTPVPSETSLQPSRSTAAGPAFTRPAPSTKS